LKKLRKGKEEGGRREEGGGRREEEGKVRSVRG
jgi:hypothetical protein